MTQLSLFAVLAALALLPGVANAQENLVIDSRII